MNKNYGRINLFATLFLKTQSQLVVVGFFVWGEFGDGNVKLR